MPDPVRGKASVLYNSMSVPTKKLEKAAHAMTGDVNKKPTNRKTFRPCVFCAKDTHKAKNCKANMTASDRLKEISNIKGDFCKKCNFDDENKLPDGVTDNAGRMTQMIADRYRIGMNQSNWKPWRLHGL